MSIIGARKNKKRKGQKEKTKAGLSKRKLRRKLNNPQFDLELPEDEDGSDSNYWIN